MSGYTILGLIILFGIMAAIDNNKKKPQSKYDTWKKPYKRSIFTALKQLKNKYENEFIERQSSLTKWPFIKRKLMTKTECKLYRLLQEAVPHLCIFAQVQLSQIIFFPEVNKIKEQNYWTNRISRMSLDFVITNQNFETVTVIELDDPSHNRPERKERDLKKDKALRDAGIQIIRIPIDQIPSKELLRKKIISLDLDKNRSIF